MYIHAMPVVMNKERFKPLSKSHLKFRMKSVIMLYFSDANVEAETTFAERHRGIYEETQSSSPRNCRSHFLSKSNNKEKFKMKSCVCP